MKWSSTLHTLTVLVGCMGVLALLGAWFTGENGVFLGFSQEHLFNDAITLLLIAIWISLGTLIHVKNHRS